MMAETHDLLYHLGVTTNYTGFFHTACAVQLCIEQPERLLLVTKWVYPDVARQYGTNWKAVERNIRTVNCVIWRENRRLLEELAHRRLERKPRNAQMLAILASSLDAGPLAAHEPGGAAAPAGESDDMGSADEPADKGGGEAVAAKDSVPLGEPRIGGDDTASAPITV